jgi:PEP-CTERM motif
MTKRSFFLTAAAGLLASVAFATPSQAGSTLVTTSFSFSQIPATITDVTITYTEPVAPIANFTTLSTNIGPLTETASGDTVTISFAAISGGTGSFTFDTAAANPVGFVSIAVSGLVGTPVLSSVAAVVSSSPSGVVPEPSSMALLGIGMTGFLAFRRLFKRHAIA